MGTTDASIIAIEVCPHGLDTDGDELRGCDDPDCWGYCKPLCPPGASPDCSVAPYCGDDQCSQLETYRLCPADCDPTPLCGDFFCDPGETARSCPGDCQMSAATTRSLKSVIHEATSPTGFNPEFAGERQRKLDELKEERERGSRLSVDDILAEYMARQD